MSLAEQFNTTRPRLFLWAGDFAAFVKEIDPFAGMFVHEGTTGVTLYFSDGSSTVVPRRTDEETREAMALRDAERVKS